MKDIFIVYEIDNNEKKIVGIYLKRSNAYACKDRWDDTHQSNKYKFSYIATNSIDDFEEKSK